MRRVKGSGVVLGENVLTKPIPLEIKPITSVEPVAKLGRELDEIANYTSNYKHFSESVEWTSPTGTGQTYKVHQRIDIDWGMRRTNPKGAEKFIGKTNEEAALAGIAPELPNGSVVQLHHIGQSSKGPLVEVDSAVHKKGKKILHNQFFGEKNPEFPVDHGSKWQSDVKNYWKWRVNNDK
ncbi:MAG: HNH/ENDO VII family nuclease [Rickettsia endosymbiont of Platyusa sonomae]|nr:HNH/ENDO VII family nuclease [Rickettsia endosymbiont of Platyusa sonomae]